MSESLTVIDIIRLVGTEFVDVPDGQLLKWIELAKPMTSKRQFGKLYDQALAYLVCHKMKLCGLGSNPLGEIGKIGVGFSVGSVSEGSTSVSFGATQSSNLATDAELGLTTYGLQFLQIRRHVIIPIHCGGERTV